MYISDWTEDQITGRHLNREEGDFLVILCVGCGEHFEVDWDVPEPEKCIDCKLEDMKCEGENNGT